MKIIIALSVAVAALSAFIAWVWDKPIIVDDDDYVQDPSRFADTTHSEQAEGHGRRG